MSYRRDVWPILKRHCWGCHAGAMPKGGLSLDTVADFIKGGESGPGLVVGKPDESLVIQLVTGEREPAMPKDQPALSEAKVRLIRDWIQAGAADDFVAGDSATRIVIPASYARPPSVTSLAYSPDGRLLACACQSEVLILDMAGDAPPRRLPTECELVTFVEFSPDGATLVGAGGVPGAYGEARLWNVADDGLRVARRMGRDTLFRGGFSPDGSTLALGGTEGMIWLVPMDPQAEPVHLDVHSDWVLDVAFSASGQLLISGSRDKTVKVTRVETRKLLRTIASNEDCVNAVATAPGLAISAGRNRIPACYQLAANLVETDYAAQSAAEATLPGVPADALRKFETQPGEILDCATNAARTLLAVAGMASEVRVYHLSDLRATSSLANVPAPVYSVALSPDGTRLCAGSQSGQISLFDLTNGQLLKQWIPVPVDAATSTTGGVHGGLPGN